VLFPAQVQALTQEQGPINPKTALNQNNDAATFDRGAAEHGQPRVSGLAAGTEQKSQPFTIGRTTFPGTKII
jgi:hypothetical protein